MVKQPLNVLYEDNHLIAVEKPAGILVQGDASGDECMMDIVKEYLKEKYQKPGNVFLGLVHRLDRPVGGIVLFAKTSKGASRISEQIRNHEVTKIYHAQIEGTLNPPKGRLVSKLIKLEGERMAMVSEDGKIAELDYETIQIDGDRSTVKIILGTGRFHQIRAQLSEAGHPIVGDAKYGSLIPYQKGIIALYATSLAFKKATADEIVLLSLPVPSWNP